MAADAVRDAEAELRGYLNKDRQPDYSKGLTKLEWTKTLGKTNVSPVGEMIDAAIREGGWIDGRAWRKRGKGFREYDVFRPKDEKRWKAYRAAFEPIRKRLEATP